MDTMGSYFLSYQKNSIIFHNVFHDFFHLFHDYHHPDSSIGIAWDYCAGSSGFDTRAGPPLRALKFLSRIAAFVISSANG